MSRVKYSADSRFGKMRRHEQLLRRARLRRLLNTHSGPDGYQNATQISKELATDKITIQKDLNAIGAVKVRDRVGGKLVEWWIIPAYNPLLPDYRDSVDETLILNEISLKIRAHVVEMFVFKNQVIVKTERSAGPLLADWFSLVPWPEIMHVTEERSSCVLHAPDAEIAQWLIGQFMGKEEEEKDE